jgi:hypothetical protein
MASTQLAGWQQCISTAPDDVLARAAGDFVTGSTAGGLSQQLLIRIAPAGPQSEDRQARK